MIESGQQRNQLCALCAWNLTGLIREAMVRGATRQWSATPCQLTADGVPPEDCRLRFVIAPAKTWLDGECHVKRGPTKDAGETCSAVPVKDGKFSEPFKSINASLKSIQRKLNASLDNEREILYYVTDNKENYVAQKDMRRPNSFKEAILHVVLDEINKRPLEERRAIALKYFNEFKSYPQFYHDFKTFIRQIDRMRKKSRSNE